MASQMTAAKLIKHMYIYINGFVSKLHKSILLNLLDTKNDLNAYSFYCVLI